MTGHAQYDGSRYAASRPTYPRALYEAIFKHMRGFDSAWDCACGSGQAAMVLAERFKTVTATDISATQIEHAVQRPNITYRVERAEKSSLENLTLDLIVIAQALHWFHHDSFFREAKRVLKSNGLIAAWCYGKCFVTPLVDTVFEKFWQQLDQYWDKGREHIEAGYTTIKFPFQTIKMPTLTMEKEWTLIEYFNYLDSWSALKNFREKNSGRDPLQDLASEFTLAWGGKAHARTVCWPLHVLVGKK